MAEEQYNDPGARGPDPMPPVFPDQLDGAPAVDGGAVSGGGNPDAGVTPYDGTLAGKPYADSSTEDLAAETSRRGLTVQGTGANGNVVKADSIKALEADDKAHQSA